jgi:hypothetical protein
MLGCMQAALQRQVACRIIRGWGGGQMPISKDRVAQYVLDYFHRNYPDADTSTDLRKDLKLDAYDIYDTGRDLKGWKGASYTPDEFAGCKTIQDIVDLIFRRLA